jgi:hypothetical protein
VRREGFKKDSTFWKKQRVSEERGWDLHDVKDSHIAVRDGGGEQRGRNEKTVTD